MHSSTFVNPDNPNDIQARSELERRGEYIDFLEALIGQVLPALVDLIKQCLRNGSDQRPSTEQLLTRLQGMRVEVEGEYGSGTIQLDLMKARLSKEVKVKDRRIEELTQQRVRLIQSGAFSASTSFCPMQERQHTELLNAIEVSRLTYIAFYCDFRCPVSGE